MAGEISVVRLSQSDRGDFVKVFAGEAEFPCRILLPIAFATKTHQIQALKSSLSFAVRNRNRSLAANMNQTPQGLAATSDDLTSHAQALNTHGSHDTTSILGQVLALYDQGRYIDALEASKPLGDLRTWPGAEGRVLAGRLAGNLGAPRLGRGAPLARGREYHDHPQAQYFAAMNYWSRFGPVHAWRRYRNRELPEGADIVTRADWLALKAVLLASMRDFSRAEPLMIEALELDSQSAWLHVELSELLDRQDLHERVTARRSRVAEHSPQLSPRYPGCGSSIGSTETR